MSKTITYRCDRCQSTRMESRFEVDINRMLESFNINHFGDTPHVDLCTECGIALAAFLNGADR